MLKNLLVASLFSLPFFATAQAGTDIYLFDLGATKDAKTITHPKNITNRKGYDNQPFFHPTKPFIYYASFNDSGRSDIKMYNHNTGETKFITQTNEREYSPTLTPDGQFLSCIIERDNHHQDLGKYPISGGSPIVLIDDLTVGYHAWINQNELLLFVLKDSGNELHHLNLISKKDTVLAKEIGRSLHKIPGTNDMSFIQKTNSKWIIKRLNPATDEITTICVAYGTGEDLTWTPDGSIVMNENNQLYYYQPGGARQWIPFSSPAFLSGKKMTRMTVHPGGTKLALVVEEQ